MPLPTPRLAPVTTATLPRNDDMRPSKPKDLALRRWGRGTADPREPGCPQVRSGVLFASPLLLDCRADLQGCMRGLRRCSMARAGPKGRVRGPWQPMPGSVRGCRISLLHCGGHPPLPPVQRHPMQRIPPSRCPGGVIRFPTSGIRACTHLQCRNIQTLTRSSGPRTTSTLLETAWMPSHSNTASTRNRPGCQRQ